MLHKLRFALLRKICYPSVSLSTTASPKANEEIKEEKVKVGKYEINYLKVGWGPHHVLCAPGSLGTIWFDYKPQIQGFDRDKFSLVVCDPPGNGKSTVPEGDNVVDFFERDAAVYYEFMKALEVPKYSYIGWSCSGASGLILAARHPEVVNKLVVFGTSSHMLKSETENYRKMKDLNNWSKPVLEAMTKMYGKETFVNKLNKWVDNVVDNYYVFNCDDLLKDIKCPTLVLYGAKDQMVDSSHVNYLQKHIKNSRVHIYPDGKHNIHIKYAEDFNTRVQQFLLNTNDK
ncbi:valacyclovir hydrolase-like [Maniola hyperantus]|uniref:valacyclovir hydrolase-like n=1 Tax=Aphantopus hyperantus TaxID=2795564 RepID=UPI001568F446|nr:valacyclovir hydrolase-like [Maniola hyperantus]